MRGQAAAAAVTVPTQRKLTTGQPYLLTAVGPNVHTLRFENIKAGWEQWALLTGDRHHDNLHTRHDLEREHLEQAKARKAFVLDVGDSFCAMQGKYDPRADQSQLRPEDRGNNYLDNLVKNAAAFYGPYAHLFTVWGQGNHETSILNRHNTNLTDRLVHRLNSDGGGQCFVGGYGGWLALQFVLWGTQTARINLKYHHGAGGGGPVTRGVIDTNRQAVYLPDADIVVNGHSHDQYYLPIARERLTMDGKVSRDIVHFIRTGTYKDEYGDGSKGFHIEKGRPPKPLGAVWLRFYVRPKGAALGARDNPIGVDVILDNQ